MQKVKLLTELYVVAVDFDGTLVEDAFPAIGKPRMLVVDTVKKLQARGAKIILWTCRNGEALTMAENYCKHVLNLQFDAVNDNLREVQEKYGGNPRKIFADVYLDDKNIDLLSLLNLPFMVGEDDA